MLDIKIRPITRWIGKETAEPRWSQFKVTYRDNLKELEYELGRADAVWSSLVLEMWISPSLIRADGNLRKDAKPFKPGIIFRFTRMANIRYDAARNAQVYTPQPVSYPCDAFTRWEDNLRGITLSMESLRRVERFGVFKYDEIISRLALPSADGKISTKEAAADFLAKHSGVTSNEILLSETARTTAYRRAAIKLHPDTGGDQEEFQKLNDANKILQKG